MKKYILLGVFSLSVLFAGCSEKKTLLLDEGNEQQLSETTPYPTLAPDWSNWAAGSVSSPFGAAVNLYDKNEAIFGIGTVITGDTIEAKLGYRLDLDEYKEYGEAQTVVIVTMNDMVCEFQLDGKQSEGGALSVKREINEEKMESLLVTDCNLKEGENELAVHMAVHFPQIGHSSVLSISRTFQAEKSRIQTATGLCGTENELEFTMTTSEGMDERRIKAEITKGSKLYYEQLSFDSSKRCTTVPCDGDFGFELRNNSGTTGDTPAQREFLVLAMKDGKLIPIQGDKKFYMCSLTEQELCMKIPMELNGEPGEYALISLLLFDMRMDGASICMDSLFYFQ